MRAISAVKSIAPRGSEFMEASRLRLGWLRLARTGRWLRAAGPRAAELRPAVELPWAQAWEPCPPRSAVLPRRPGVPELPWSLAWAEVPSRAGRQQRRPGKAHQRPVRQRLRLWSIGWPAGRGWQ